MHFGWSLSKPVYTGCRKRRTDQLVVGSGLQRLVLRAARSPAVGLDTVMQWQGGRRQLEGYTAEAVDMERLVVEQEHSWKLRYFRWGQDERIVHRQIDLAKFLMTVIAEVGTVLRDRIYFVVVLVGCT